MQSRNQTRILVLDMDGIRIGIEKIETGNLSQCQFFFCLASLTAAELSGRQAGMRIPQVLFEPIRAS